MTPDQELAYRADRAPDRMDPLKWLLKQQDKATPELAFPTGEPRAVPGGGLRVAHGQTQRHDRA